jgi:hypothetical protein
MIVPSIAHTARVPQLWPALLAQLDKILKNGGAWFAVGKIAKIRLKYT